MIQSLRLSDTWALVRAQLQAWVTNVTADLNARRRVELLTVTYTEGVSPSPFPVAGRVSAAWLGRVVDVLTPSTAVAPTFAWVATDDGFNATFSGLTSGKQYQITFCVIG